MHGSSRSRIRRAARHQAGAISMLAMRSKAYWGYSAEFMEACRAELTWSSDALEAPGVGVFVAEVGSELAGFYAIEQVFEFEFELAALFVEPDRIGSGIGRALLEHAKFRVTKQGGRVLLIQGDPHAERFYRAAGGELIGQTPSESVPGRSLPLFRISLAENHA